MSIEQHDNREMHCRMLGHTISFGYCRRTSGEQPCRKIFDCWFETFDVEKFAREYFTADQLAAILAPPKPRIASIIELIQKAQNTSRSE